MKPGDWTKLCKNIASRKCILIVGPDLPICSEVPGFECTDTDKFTLSQLLSKFILSEMDQNQYISDFVKQRAKTRELPQIAGDYIKFGGTSARENLANSITNFFKENHDKLHSPVFKKLVKDLPFTFIVDTNYTTFLSDELKEANKNPSSDFYNFKGPKVDTIASGPTGFLGTEANPFVYNLFGHSSEMPSVVFSENDLVAFIVSLIRSDPGLPVNVHSALGNKERYFLFIGFGILSKNWYFRILLHALGSSEKDNASLSYAVETIEKLPADDDPVLIFFKDELKMSIYKYDVNEFIDELIKQYQPFKGAPVDDRPRAFISHKTEDFEHADRIRRIFEDRKIIPYIDRFHQKGMFESTLKAEIDRTDAYVLIQSKNLANEDADNYVFWELNHAMKRAEKFLDKSLFIYPGYVDGRDTIIKKLPELKAIDSVDLSTDSGVIELAQRINRNYERKIKGVSYGQSKSNA